MFRVEEGEAMSRFFVQSFKAFVVNKLHIDFRSLGLLAAVALALLQGCSMVPHRLTAVPDELTARAEIPGMPGVRYVAGGDATELTKAALDALKRERDYLAKEGRMGR